MESSIAKQLRRVRTLGRGASGAVVWLASDEASGELMAVKSAAAAGAAQLRREGRVLAGLRSPHIVPCLGSRAAAGGEYQLFLEFAPGGTLADEAARSGGRLAERAIRAYAGDVARGLAYLHGRSLVHGDVKARNVVIGGDDRAMLMDFGCARHAESSRPIGGTPAFMAPEVARGEEQGFAADVWALGCTVIEMATGSAPWSDMDDVFAAVHRIGYTDAAPEVPGWLSPEAKHFLDGCFVRLPGDRSTAAQLVDHPFLACVAAVCDSDAQPPKQEHVSPMSTLHDAFWDTDTDDEADEMSKSAAERIAALACPTSAIPDWDFHTDDEADETSPSAAERIGALASTTSALPDWDSEEGWIDLQDDHHEPNHDAPPAAGTDLSIQGEPSDEEEFERFAAPADGSDHFPRNAVVTQTSRRQGSFSEIEIPQTFDHDGIGTMKSHRFCSRKNRVKMKRALLQNSPLLRSAGS
ncbi:hypothetical protein ACP70R_036940 [Stipagrostis hirtigluma subsp. patula]